MTEILLMLACVPLYALNSFCDKLISKNGAGDQLRYNCMKFLLGSLILLPLFCLDSAPKWEVGVILCGVGCGVMYAINKTVILKGYQRGSVVFMTVCHASGMIVPCIIGHFFWSEPLGWLSTVGILLAIFSIVLLKNGKQGEDNRTDPLGVLIGIVVFLTSGGVMVMQKLMGLCFSEQSVSAYNFYSFVVAFLLLCPFVRPSGEKPKKMRPTLLCAVGSASSLCIISLVMTALAGKVPSVILFPLYNGLGILTVCVGSALLFHEKWTKRKSVGVLIGLVGMFLINC